MNWSSLSLDDRILGKMSIEMTFVIHSQTCMGRRKVFDTGKFSIGKLVDNFGISGAVRLGFVGQLSCQSLSVSITFLHLVVCKY